MRPVYTFIRVCPDTDEQLTKQEVLYSGGVCPRCGHNNHCSVTHHNVVVGHWEWQEDPDYVPNWLDRVFGKTKRQKSVFIKKEQS